MRVYLAGPVGKNCWRHGIVRGLHDVDGRRAWPVLERGVLDRFDYVGPYFDAGCDHGCGHGPESHGIDARNVCVDSEFPGRPWVVSRCLSAVGLADVVFAWLDRPDCHGTALEVGAALAIGRGVAVGYPSDDRSKSAWFLGAAADLQDSTRIFSGRFKTPAAAFQELVVNRAEWFERNSESIGRRQTRRPLL